MTSKENNISALYAELNKLGQNGEYERALKTANRSTYITNYRMPLELYKYRVI